MEYISSEVRLPVEIYSISLNILSLTALMEKSCQLNGRKSNRQVSLHVEELATQ